MKIGFTDCAFKLVLKANHCALDTGTLLFPFVVIPKEKEIRPLARPTPEPKYAFLCPTASQSLFFNPEGPVP